MPDENRPEKIRGPPCSTLDNSAIPAVPVGREEEEAAGSAFTIIYDDPWPDPVSLAPLLDELAAKLREYIISLLSG